MDPLLLEKLPIALLFVVSVFVVSYLSQTLFFLSQRTNGFWLKVMLWGMLAYFLMLGSLTLLRVIGVRDTELGGLFFSLYVGTSVVMAMGVGCFCQYVVGGLPSPKHNPDKPAIPDIGVLKHPDSE